MGKLEAGFFLRDTVEVARDLLGRYLLRRDGEETMVCRITETEAYVAAIDKACHAYGGRRTARTETLYAGPGTAYVYLIYGVYHCLNFITGPEGVASGVLIRGCRPVCFFSWRAYSNRSRAYLPSDRTAPRDSRR